MTEVYKRCNAAMIEPANFREAAKSEVWRNAMQEEINMIEKNGTWELVDRPKTRRVIQVKWIFKRKLRPDGSVYKHKARLVVKGFAQQYGMDFSDTFAPVARHDTIRILLALAAQFEWRIYQLDVKSAFLNGWLNEEIFVEQPEGYEVKGQVHKVYLLRKALYGLKQAPRAWYNRINEYLMSLGYARSANEHTLYVRRKENECTIISLYVDDLLIMGSSSNQLIDFKSTMHKEFEMTDLGEMSYFLGMEIHQSHHGIFVNQKRYTTQILHKYNMDKCKPVDTPLAVNLKLSKDDGAEKVDETMYRSIIGCLLYLTATRPDLMFAASVLSRFMSNPSEIHLKAAKRVLRYVKGSVELGIWFKKAEKLQLIGYSDSDWAGCIDDMRSTSGYVFFLNSGAVCWHSKKQDTTAQSTAEPEYISAAAAVNQAIWLRKVMLDLRQIQEEPTVIFCDNQSAVAMAKNPILHGKTKHIKIKFHAVREVESNAEVKLIHCRGEDQLADIMTKGLPKTKFESLRLRLGVSSKLIKEE